MVRPSYGIQTFFNAFSSPDLVHWTKHEHVLDVANVSWAAYAVWAPSAIEKDGKYYLFFGANDIQKDGETGGIGVAVSDSPAGPFKRSEEHTSELQSLMRISYAVFCLKKQNNTNPNST